MVRRIPGISIVVITIMLSTCLAFAEIDAKVLVQGKVGDFDAKSVQMITDRGAMIIVPRSTIRAGADQLRPGGQVAAIVHFDDIKLIKKRK